MLTQAHYSKQKQYFTEEFKRLKGLPIQPWQYSYIQKISEYVVGKNKKRNSVMLDIATGSGYVAIHFARLGFKVIACDLVDQSLQNINKVKKSEKLNKLTLIKCYAENIPLPSSSVDYIISSAILEHIPDEQKAIKEWIRLLKPKGRILVAVPIKYRYIFPLFWPINYIHDKRIGHLRRYDLPTLESKFRLKVIKTFYTGNIIKVLLVLLQKVIGVDTLDNLLEVIDKKFDKYPLWASNIIVILEK